MTKQEAINELTRAAELCPTTPLAEACRTLIAWMEQPHVCGTCKHCESFDEEEPCASCYDTEDRWEPKEV